MALRKRSMSFRMSATICEQVISVFGSVLDLTRVGSDTCEKRRDLIVLSKVAFIDDTSANAAKQSLSGKSRFA